MELVAEKYKETEVGLIPSDWEVKTIGEIFTFYSTSNFSKAEMLLNGEVGCVHYGLIHAIDNSHYSLSNGTKYYVTKEQAKYENLQDGDVIMVDASEDLVGLNKSVEIFNLNNKEYIAGLHTFHLRDVNSNYVGTFRGLILNSNSVKKQMLRLAVGMKVFGVSKPQLQQVFVPVPPKSEQSAIATVLSDADTLITNLENLITKKRNIKQGAMQKLLQPKASWEVNKLGSIGKPYGGLSGKSKLDFANGRFPYIPFMNIMSNPIIDTSYVDYVSIGIDENQNKALKGDLFFNGSSETPEEVGMCSVLLEDIPNLYLNSFCFGFRLNKDSKENGLYLSYFFRSSEGRKLFYSMAQGATRYNLSKGNFNKLDVPLPKQEEQIEIANILTDMNNEIIKLEAKLEKYRNLKLGMLQTLLTGKIRL
jgi:type I restriction enzyme S subunit